MNLNIHTIDSYLHSYTEREQLYRDYYQLKTNNQTEELQHLLSSIDMEWFERNRIILPEIPSPRYQVIPGKLIQNEMLSWKDTSPDILLEKHPRYIPEFEHDHAYFEMIYVYKGSCTNQVDGTIHTLVEGDVFILAPRIRHSIAVFDDSIIINVQIKPQALSGQLNPLCRVPTSLSDFFHQAMWQESSYSPWLFTRTGQNISLKNTMRQALVEYFSHQELWDIIAGEHVALFLSLLVRYQKNDFTIAPQTKKHGKKIGAILAVIQEHYKTLTLADLAKQFHYSPQYISTLIKEHTGKTFVSLQRDLRLDYARHILLSSNSSISFIASDAGYESEEYFIRIFKSQFGCSPLKYRQKIKLI